jgi:pilus assembly protein CpaE
VLAILRTEFDWVIVDTSRSWDEACVRTLSLADQIILVTLFDVPTLNHTRQHMRVLDSLGHDVAKIRTVANRYSKNDDVTISDFSQVLGSEPVALIPNSYATTVESVNQGKPIGQVSPNSAIHKAYQRLALDVYSWCGIAPPPTKAPRKLAGRVRGMFSKRKTHGSS